MAGETLASINSALSQLFAPDLSRQWNRSAIVAALVAATAGAGKNAAWDVEFTGATATTVAEGSDVSDSEYNSDIDQPAILNWAHYRSSFKISETELDAAASSVGTATALQALFGDRILGCGAKIARAINADMITGTGTDGLGNNSIVGLLGGSLEQTGSYAGLARGSFPEWNGNVMANGGVTRPLTLDLLAQMDANIFASSREPWTHLLVSAGVLRKYEGLFEPNRRLNGGGNPAQLPSYGSGAKFDNTMQIDAWYKGRPVLRDPSVTAGNCVFFNANQVQTKYLPRVFMPQDAVMAKLLGLQGNSGSVTDSTSIPARVAILAKTGDSLKVSVKTTLAMLVRRPNALGYIKDISEV